jgi:hypothetical protein
MSHRIRYPNLHQLVGDSISQLSPDVAQRVEDVLSRCDGQMPAQQTPVDAGGVSADAVQPADLRRAVEGLGTLTRVMYAAHIARTRGGQQNVLPPGAMEGLILAARELTCHVQQQLQAERIRGTATLQ